MVFGALSPSGPPSLSAPMERRLLLKRGGILNGFAATPFPNNHFRKRRMFKMDSSLGLCNWHHRLPVFSGSVSPPGNFDVSECVAFRRELTRLKVNAEGGGGVVYSAFPSLLPILLGVVNYVVFKGTTLARHPFYGANGSPTLTDPTRPQIQAHLPLLWKQHGLKTIAPTTQ